MVIDPFNVDLLTPSPHDSFPGKQKYIERNTLCRMTTFPRGLFLAPHPTYLANYDLMTNH